MTNEEILNLVRTDRPDQVIHKVIDFKPSNFGLIEVMVDMEGMFFFTKVKHVHMKIPYPLANYLKLSDAQQTKWRLESTWSS